MTDLMGTLQKACGHQTVVTEQPALIFNEYNSF